MGHIYADIDSINPASTNKPTAVVKSADVPGEADT